MKREQNLRSLHRRVRAKRAWRNLHIRLSTFIIWPSPNSPRSPPALADPQSECSCAISAKSSWVEILVFRSMRMLIASLYDIEVEAVSRVNRHGLKYNFMLAANTPAHRVRTGSVSRCEAENGANSAKGNGKLITYNGKSRHDCRRVARRINPSGLQPSYNIDMYAQIHFASFPSKHADSSRNGYTRCERIQKTKWLTMAAGTSNNRDLNVCHVSQLHV